MGVDPAKPRRILEAFGTSSQRQGEMPSVSHQQHQQQTHIPPRKDCRILVVGCGNSRLAEDMVRDGWTGGIVGVDWSPIVIDQMEAMYSPEYLQRILMNESMRHGRNASNQSGSFPLLEFRCANVLEGLPFDDGTFDLILCKGVFDAVISSSASNARLLNQECHRLLQSNHGSMVIITHGNPESRIVFFENPNDEWWSEVGIHTLAKPITDRRHLIENLDGSK
jgi:SAM-dependent methyltransferase